MAAVHLAARRTWKYGAGVAQLTTCMLFSAQRVEVALDARAGMFGAPAFIAVREQEREASAGPTSVRSRERNLSIMIWARLAKSRRTALPTMTSESGIGHAVAAKPSTAYSLRELSYTSKCA